MTKGDKPTRRTVLAAAALSGGVSLVGARSALAYPPVHGVINALGGLEDPNLDLARRDPALPDPSVPGVNARAIADALASGLCAVNVTLGYVAGPMDPYVYSLETLAAWDRLIAATPDKLLKVRTAGDIRRARREGRIGVIYGFQNMVQLGHDLDRIDRFQALGLRVAQLTYNPANTLGDGSMAPLNRGLTPFGREAVARLNARRVMVDLSHSGERTCLDALAASTQPISINHTGCRALCDLPRNKTDAELRGVAERGGFVGIYFMPYLTLSGHAHAEDVAARIDHAVQVCGEDHVGIGTDGSITAIDDLQAYQSHLAAEIAGRAKAGIGATGEKADTYPFVIDLRGVDQFRKLADLLRARGYGARRIDKILGDNFLRFATDVWGA